MDIEIRVPLSPEQAILNEALVHHYADVVKLKADLKTKIEELDKEKKSYTETSKEFIHVQILDAQKVKRCEHIGEPRWHLAMWWRTLKCSWFGCITSGRLTGLPQSTCCRCGKKTIFASGWVLDWYAPINRYGC